MIRFTLILVLFVCQLLVGQNLQSVTEKYNPYVSETTQGIGILIEKDGQTQFSNIGKGNFNQHTVFNIGSATKKMTAILLLQEVEKGNLKLSDSIGKFLNPVKNVDMSLSVETLLRHRSGLGEFVGKNFEQNFFEKKDSIYNQDFLMSIPKNKPKKIGKHSYCNTNYLLLGKLLEKVTDKSYFDLLRERIFIPTEMTESYPYVSRSLKNLAKPTFKGKDVSEFLDYRFFANYAYSAGSVASTLHDMQKFYKHLFEKKTLISESSLTQLISFDDADYGLGIMKFDDGFIGHGGNNMGYSFREYYNPTTKEMILYFSNSWVTPFNKMIKSELFDYIHGNVSEVTFNQNIAKDYETVVGKYQFDAHGMKMEMKVIKRKNHLYFAVPAQKAEVILISKEKNKLYNGGFGIELEVNPNNNGELKFRQGGMETTLKRIKE